MTTRGRSAAIAGGVCAATFALFAWTACRTVYFGDSGELIAVAHGLGVAHPPGYPLYALLGRLALALPLGEPAFRMNLMSALFGALTCGLVAGWTMRWSRSAVAAVGAAGSLATGAAFWGAATVAEVYTLHLLFVAGLLACAQAAGAAPSSGAWRRAALAACAVLGLGLAHRPTILLAVPAALVLARVDLRRRLRESPRTAILGAALVVAIPILFYGWMMVRARTGPAINWGHPVDLARLIDHVTTRQFDVYRLGPAAWLAGPRWTGAFSLLAGAAGWPALALASAGMAAGLSGRVGREAREAAATILALGAPTLLLATSYGTEDVEVLFLPVFLALALAVGLGLAAVARRPGRQFVVAGAVLSGIAVGYPAAIHGSRCDLHTIRAAADHGADMLATLPDRAILFVQGDEAFLLAYRVQVLGERPDVTILDREGNVFPDELSLPGSPARPGEGLLDLRVRREIELIRHETNRRDGRPVLFMTWPGYELPPDLRFEPWGLFYLARPAAARPLDPRALWTSYAEERIRDEAERTGHPHGRTIAARYRLMRGERALFEGDGSLAERSFDEASALARDSESIHNYLGTIFGRLGDYDRAIREFELATRIKPVSVRAWNNLALACSLKGDDDGTRAALRRSLALQPDQPDARARLRALGG